MSAGYSGKPLATKLGIRPGFRLLLVDAPSGYLDLLGPLPDGVIVENRRHAPLDFIQFFVRERGALQSAFPSLAKDLRPDGMLWISWPKRASKQPTDLDENIVREIGLACGLVDVKVAAIDQIWSGLKFVYRLKDRPQK